MNFVAAPATRHEEHATGTRDVIALEGLAPLHEKGGDHVSFSMAYDHDRTHLLRALYSVANVAAQVRDREFYLRYKRLCITLSMCANSTFLLSVRKSDFALRNIEFRLLGWKWIKDGKPHEVVNDG